MPMRLVDRITGLLTVYSKILSEIVMGKSYIRDHSCFPTAYDEAVAVIDRMIDGAANADMSLTFPDNSSDYAWRFTAECEHLIPFKFGSIALQNHKTPNIPDPEEVRWELRRVLIIEGCLSPGESSQLPYRRYYIDRLNHVVLFGEGFSRGRSLLRWYLRCFDAKGVTIGPGRWYIV